MSVLVKKKVGGLKRDLIRKLKIRYFINGLVRV